MGRWGLEIVPHLLVTVRPWKITIHEHFREVSGDDSFASGGWGLCVTCLPRDLYVAVPYAWCSAQFPGQGAIEASKMLAECWGGG